MGKIRGKNLIKIFTRPNNGDKAEVSLIRSRVNESNERRERWNIPTILYLPSFTSSTNSIRLPHFRVLSSINDTCLPPFSTGKPRETLSPPSSSDVINSACPSRRWHTIVYHPRGWNKSPFRISSSPRKMDPSNSRKSMGSIVPSDFLVNFFLPLRFFERKGEV